MEIEEGWLGGWWNQNGELQVQWQALPKTQIEDTLGWPLIYTYLHPLSHTPVRGEKETDRDKERGQRDRGTEGEQAFIFRKNLLCTILIICVRKGPNQYLSEIFVKNISTETLHGSQGEQLQYG